VFRYYASRAGGDSDDVMNLDEFDLLLADGGFLPPVEGEEEDEEEVREDERKLQGWARMMDTSAPMPDTSSLEDTEEEKSLEADKDLKEDRVLLSPADARSCFSLSQSEFSFGVVDLLSGESKENLFSEDHREQMTYPEFLESIVRIAAIGWRKPEEEEEEEKEEKKSVKIAEWKIERTLRVIAYLEQPEEDQSMF